MLQALYCLFLTNTASLMYLDYGTLEAIGLHAVGVGAVALALNVLFVASVTRQIPCLLGWVPVAQFSRWGKNA